MKKSIYDLGADIRAKYPERIHQECAGAFIALMTSGLLGGGDSPSIAKRVVSDEDADLIVSAMEDSIERVNSLYPSGAKGLSFTSSKRRLGDGKTEVTFVHATTPSRPAGGE